MQLLALALVLSAPQAPAKIPALIVSGANNHDWEFTSPSLERTLEESGLFEATITYEPARTLADARELGKYAVLVLDYNGPRWGEPAESNFLAAVRGGTGVSVIHAANNAFPGWTEYETLVGHLWRDGTGHGKFHAFDVTVFDREHPITRGLFDLRGHPDELYHRLWRAPASNHRVLASAWSTSESGGTGEAEPMLTVGSYGQGRVFHTPLGHVWKGDLASRASHADRQFQELVVRGTEWAARGDCSGRVSTANLMTKEEHDQGWRLLFDGTSTHGWRGYRQAGFPEQGWKVEEGELRLAAGGGGGDLVTSETFGDFELEFDWRVGPKANSGVIYRVSEEGGATYESGPEYQVIDDAYFAEPDALHEAGALYALAAAESKTLLPVGSFNRGRIVVRGWSIEHWLNGRRLFHCDLESEDGRARLAASKFAQMPLFAQADVGHIALQDHGDAVAYRSLKVRELDGGAHALRLFNGSDLAGWQGFHEGGAAPGSAWKVIGGGILACAGTPTGYLFTEKYYESYVLELDWRWDPEARAGGNSGVLLRVGGEPRIWPRSLEAQLKSGSAGDFHVFGDFVVGALPERGNARRGSAALRTENPVGQWNHYRISVDRGVVTLEVNGALVNQAVGVEILPGRIGLQSEGGAIQFKDILLTPIE
jgi:type 1 glutamine amidotransferase